MSCFAPNMKKLWLLLLVFTAGCGTTGRCPKNSLSCKYPEDEAAAECRNFVGDCSGVNVTVSVHDSSGARRTAILTVIDQQSRYHPNCVDGPAAPSNQGECSVARISFQEPPTSSYQAKVEAQTTNGTVAVDFVLSPAEIQDVKCCGPSLVKEVKITIL